MTAPSRRWGESRARKALELLRDLNRARRTGSARLAMILEERLRAFDEHRQFRQPKGQGLLYLGGRPVAVIYDVRYSDWKVGGLES